MTKKKDESRKFKLEGRAFDRVKAKRQALTEASEEAKRIHEEAHKAFWEAIHDELPETNREGSYSIDPSYEDLGFYVVKENDSDALSGLLGALKAKLQD